jgi:arylesterase / paraoxonase
MKKAAISFLIIILVIGSFVLRTVWHSGAFKTITNDFSGSTQKVEGIPGVEDLTIDRTTGIAFLSSDDRWASMLYKKPVKGAIYRLNLNDSLPQPINLTIGFEQPDFHPHGISLFSNSNGRKFLFVVNHRNERNFIEIFEYVNDSLKHRESISHDLIISPNDVVGVGERQFYFTNDHNEKAGTWRYIKDLLTIGTGNVCYYDGQTVQETSVHGVKYANGVNVSLNRKKMYVAAASDLKVLVC